MQEHLSCWATPASTFSEFSPTNARTSPIRWTPGYSECSPKWRATSTCGHCFRLTDHPPTPFSARRAAPKRCFSLPPTLWSTLSTGFGTPTTARRCFRTRSPCHPSGGPPTHAGRASIASALSPVRSKLSVMKVMMCKSAFLISPLVPAAAA